MNLLDQIDDRLKDADFGLNRDVFEDCSTSPLSALHPKLVLISGGSDNGRDAEIEDPDGTIAQRRDHPGTPRPARTPRI